MFSAMFFFFWRLLQEIILEISYQVADSYRRSFVELDLHGHVQLRGHELIIHACDGKLSWPTSPPNMYTNKSCKQQHDHIRSTIHMVIDYCWVCSVFSKHWLFLLLFLHFFPVITDSYPPISFFLLHSLQVSRLGLVL